MGLPPKLYEYIEKKTNPKMSYLIYKLILNHLITGIITIALCPQWGIGLIPNFEGLRIWFMKLGHFGCEMTCGLFYIFMFWISYLINFSVFEKRKLHSQFGLSQLLFLSNSLGFIFILGTILGYHPLLLFTQIHLAWILGYAMGYLAMFILTSSFNFRS